MRKETVLKIIDETMNNREIDSIRNAILAIRDKVLELDDTENPLIIDDAIIVKVKLRGNHIASFGNQETGEYLCIDAHVKVDTGEYGAIWYE